MTKATPASKRQPPPRQRDTVAGSKKRLKEVIKAIQTEMKWLSSKEAMDVLLDKGYTDHTVANMAIMIVLDAHRKLGFNGVPALASVILQTWGEGQGSSREDIVKVWGKNWAKDFDRAIRLSIHTPKEPSTGDKVIEMIKNLPDKAEVEKK